MPKQTLLFAYWLFRHPIFWFTPYTVIETTHGSLSFTVQHLCDLQDAMSFHLSPVTLTDGNRGFP